MAYVFTKSIGNVYAGALVFRTLLPDLELILFGQVWGPFWLGAFATVVLTGIYTVFGGFRAVLYTDSVQALLLILGSASITWIGLDALGGWGELVRMASERSDELTLWRPLQVEGSGIPWWKTMIFRGWELSSLHRSSVFGIGVPINTSCSEPSLQKILTMARRGAIWGAFLKVWPVLIFLLPGIIGWELHQKGILHIPMKAQGTTAMDIDGDQVFATMVIQLLPAGLRGLVVGGLLAALMSSLSSLFNSCATLFTVDIYEKICPKRSEKHLVRVGRVATTIIVALGLLWIPVMYRIAGGGIYQYLQSVQGYLAPPITAVFLLGLFLEADQCYRCHVGVNRWLYPRHGKISYSSPV